MRELCDRFIIYHYSAIEEAMLTNLSPNSYDFYSHFSLYVPIEGRQKVG
jgi:hypothetical protein